MAYSSLRGTILRSNLPSYADRKLALGILVVFGILWIVWNIQQKDYIQVNDDTGDPITSGLDAQSLNIL